ncbi:Uncharacterised protein [Mycobacterium tuberculosis]|nr:Uncharacterised protein [Mycobacterium tuberculosis]
MLHDDTVFEHRNLGVPRARQRWLGADPVAHHHHPLDRLTASQKLGLTQHRWAAPAGVAPVAAALPLGFQAGRAVDALDLSGARAAILRVAGLVTRAGHAFVYDSVGRIVRQRAL